MKPVPAHIIPLDPVRVEMETYFGPDGLLARTLPGYEFRSQQLEMATTVTRTIRQTGRAVIEAGTGTGKTLSYLIPALLSGKRTLVSTATKNLQEQIYFKDLALLEALGMKFKASYLKGRSNYLCRFRFEQFKMAPLFRSASDAAYFDEILAWSEVTESGDRAELRALPDDFSTWADLSTTPEGCLGSQCPDFDDCFVTRVRRQAAGSQLIIVNHHLFFGDLAVRGGGFGEVLPEVEVAIFDEAHHLEETATSFFGRGVTLFRYRDLKVDVERALKDVGKPPKKLLKGLKSCDDGLRTLFKAIDDRLPRDERVELGGAVIRHPGVLDEKETTLADLAELEVSLSTTGSLGELAAVFSRRCREIRDDLSFILEAADPSWVYFSEHRGDRRWLALSACPIDLAGMFQELMYPLHTTTVFTSATLTVSDEFTYFRSRIALGTQEPVRELKLESSFDFETQALLFIPEGLPQPTDPGFARAIAPVIEQLLHVTRGRAFVLFTSYRNLREVHEILRPQLPYPVLVQGERSKSALLDEFRRTPSVLMATQSFWEGVDVPGENLSLVVIDKLPFASPGDPVVKARINYIRDQGGDPFNHYQLPQAAIALKQGFGRLIRHREDRGIVAVLDRRLVERSYGRVFLATLPQAPLTRSLAEVQRWWQALERNQPGAP